MTPQPNGTTPTSTVDPKNDLLVITCASGKQSSAILPHVSKTYTRLRLICRTEASAYRLRNEYPDAEVLTADLSVSTEPDRIIKDATAIYHVEPPFAHRQAVMGFNMIDAAKREVRRGGGKFKHFVYASVLNPQLSKMLHHTTRLSVEAYLLESTLPYTILNPTHFMFLFPIAPLLSSPPNIPPTFHAPWSPSTPFSFLNLTDLGIIASKILTQRETHYYASYPLVSDGPLNYYDICAIVSKEIGREIRCEGMRVEEAREVFLKRIFGGRVGDVDGGEGKAEGEGGISGESVDGVERMLLYYNRHGLLGNKNVCEWLLGRKATSWKEFARGEVGRIMGERGREGGEEKKGI